MTTTFRDNKISTLINIFFVEHLNQQQLVEFLIKATNESIRHSQGFISTSLHRSIGHKGYYICTMAEY